MTDTETLEERVRTVERALTDGDHELPAATDLAALEERVAAVEETVATLDDRTAELEAATQALRGYVGNVRSVNERVEQRADAALAATDRLSRRLDGADGEGRPADGGPAGERREPSTGRRNHGGDRSDGTEQSHTGADVDGLEMPRTEGTGTRSAEHPDARTAATADPDDDAAGVLERVRALL